MRVTSLVVYYFVNYIPKQFHSYIARHTFEFLQQGRRSTVAPATEYNLEHAQYSSTYTCTYMSTYTTHHTHILRQQTNTTMAVMQLSVVVLVLLNLVLLPTPIGAELAPGQIAATSSDKEKAASALRGLSPSLIIVVVGTNKETGSKKRTQHTPARIHTHIYE